MPADAADRTTPEAVAEALGWTGVVTKPMRLLDRQVRVVLDLSAEEVRRRKRADLGAFTDRRTLDVLLNIPRRKIWPKHEAEAALSPHTLKFLAERGAIDSTSKGYRRVLAPIGKVAGVLSSASSWQSQAEAVSRFAAYAQRAITVAPESRDVTATCCEASVLGIGVVTGGRVPKVLVPPSDAAAEWSAWHWLVAEWAYSRLRFQLGKEGKQDVGYADIAAGSLQL